MSNFISSPSDRKKEKEKKLNNYTIFIFVHHKGSEK